MPTLLLPGASSCVNSHKWKELRLNTDHTGTARLSYALANNKKQCLPRLTPMPSISRQEFVLLMIQLRGVIPKSRTLLSHWGSFSSVPSQIHPRQEKGCSESPELWNGRPCPWGSLETADSTEQMCTWSASRSPLPHYQDRLKHWYFLPIRFWQSHRVVLCLHLSSPGQNKQPTVNFPEHFRLCFLICKPPYKEISW